MRLMHKTGHTGLAVPALVATLVLMLAGCSETAMVSPPATGPALPDVTADDASPATAHAAPDTETTATCRPKTSDGSVVIACAQAVGDPDRL